ncbi:MAG: condensation domain-containing protein [Desulfobacter sp.]
MSFSPNYYIPDIYCGNFIFTTRLDLTEIDQDIFYKALNLFIESNNAFRLQCAKINGEYYQYFADYTHAALDYHGFRVPDGGAAMEEWTNGLEANSMLGMNQPMYYFSLFRYPDGGYGFLQSFHHILADYNSGVDLLEAVLGNYKLLSRGENPVIEITDYQDYMDHENSYLESSGFAEDKAYWLDKIKGYEEPVVYADHSDHTSMKVKRADCPISPELSALIAEFGSTHKASIFGLFMSALYVYYYNVQVV